MPGDIRTIQPGDPKAFQQQLASHFDRPRAQGAVVAGAEVADVRRIVISVVDRLGTRWGRRWLLRVWIAGVAGGPPSATGNTVTVVTGQVIQVVTANAAYLVETDDDGNVTLDLGVAGAGSRWVRSVVVEQVNQSGELAWT